MNWSQHKYGATRVSHAGYSFASKLEAATFDLLSILHRGKEIQCQKHIKLTRAGIVYIVDFVITGDSSVLYAEAKGMETPEWKIKKRLWAAGYGPGTLEIYGGSWKSPRLIETIIPNLGEE